MFNTVSMTGTGISTLLAGVLVEVLSYVGVTIAQTQAADAVVAASTLIGLVLTVIGQLRRKDLKMGIVRKKSC